MGRGKSKDAESKTMVGARMPTDLVNRMKAKARKMAVDQQTNISLSYLIAQACREAYPEPVAKKRNPK